MAELTATSVAAAGTTTFRPPYVPVAIGALAGLHRARELRPTRLTPSHRWAQRHAAVFTEAGHWLRAQWYAQPGEEALAAVNREVLAVRTAVGVCDVSTLGKIDLQGTDAVALLERLYATGLGTLAVGRVRYGLMLREDGFVLDDGTVSRLAEDRFIITTTTVNAARVLQHMEFSHQWLWPELDVQIVAVDERWGQYAIAGPHARAVLQRVIDPPLDLADAAFPYLAAGEITVMGGVRARLFRVSFSGELGYEIAVPAAYGAALFARIMVAGADFAIAPYGTEALTVLRIEKGHIAGNEINGQTTAGDLGMARMLARNKDYIGRVMAERPGLTAADRPALIGVRPLDCAQRLFAGAHFIAQGARPTAANDEGYVTSVAYSPTLGQWIGLGLLAGGPRREGDHIRAWDPLRGGDVVVEVCRPVFYDPQGERLRG
jgi:sarcosine oxidase subunit alpha